MDAIEGPFNKGTSLMAMYRFGTLFKLLDVQSSNRRCCTRHLRGNGCAGCAEKKSTENSGPLRIQGKGRRLFRNGTVPLIPSASALQEPVSEGKRKRGVKKKRAKRTRGNLLRHTSIKRVILLTLEVYQPAVEFLIDAKGLEWRVGASISQPHS